MHCLIFPGQGVQHRGMGQELFARYPDETRAASELLGYSVAEVCRTGPDGRLAGTRYAQPAVFLVNALAGLDRHRSGRRYDWFAGYGLGEFNALVAAGVLDLMDALALVRHRAELMDGVAGGAMVAVTGSSAGRVETTLRRAGLNQVYVANRDSDEQVTVAGDRRQLTVAARALLRSGARGVHPVAVSGPFHTPLMVGAGRDFVPMLRRFEFRAGHTPVMSSVTAAPFRPEQAVVQLNRQIFAPVQWVDTVRALRGAGVEHFDEVNGTTLTPLLEQIADEPVEEYV
jgi:[acyl-carrier-protein] S-malonyltransferase